MKKLLLVCAALLFAGQTFSQNIPENTVLKRLDGSEVKMKDVLKDDVVIISFWATWCKPCHAELDALYDIEEMWRDKVRIVAISTDDARTTASSEGVITAVRAGHATITAAAGGKTGTCALTVNPDIYTASMESTGIGKQLFVVRKNGETLYSHTGYTPGNERLVVQKALEYIK